MARFQARLRWPAGAVPGRAGHQYGRCRAGRSAAGPERKVIHSHVVFVSRLPWTTETTESVTSASNRHLPMRQCVVSSQSQASTGASTGAPSRAFPVAGLLAVGGVEQGIAGLAHGAGLGLGGQQAILAEAPSEDRTSVAASSSATVRTVVRIVGCPSLIDGVFRTGRMAGPEILVTGEPVTRDLAGNRALLLFCQGRANRRPGPSLLPGGAHQEFNDLFKALRPGDLYPIPSRCCL